MMRTGSILLAAFLALAVDGCSVTSPGEPIARSMRIESVRLDENPVLEFDVFTVMNKASISERGRSSRPPNIA